MRYQAPNPMIFGIIRASSHVFQMSPFKRANEAMDKSAEFIYSVCR